MKILQISTYDHGGAGKAARRLNTALNMCGIDSSMMVVDKRSDDHKVIEYGSQLSMFALKKQQIYNRLVQTDNMVRRLTNFIIIHTGYMNGACSENIHQNVTELFSNDKSAYKIEDHELVSSSDIINLHWVSRSINYRSFFPAITGKPIVWTLHDMTPFTGGCYYSSNCTKYLNNCGGCPLLGSVANNDISRRVWKSKQRSYRGQLIKVVTPSRWLAECARKSSLFNGIEINVIPNAISTEQYDEKDKNKARKELGITTDKKLILFSASSVTNKRKGMDYLVRALKSLSELKDIAVIIVGEDSKILLKNRRLTTYFTGHISSGSRMADYYNAADIFVLPSLEDNLPNTVMESMACGTPVAAFDVGGVSDMVRDGETGLLAKPLSPEDLCDKIEWMLDHDHEREQMGKNARKIAEVEYSLKVQGERYRSLYNGIMMDINTHTLKKD